MELVLGWEILRVAVNGISAMTRTNRGIHLVPVSGWVRQNSVNAAGSNSAPGSSWMTASVPKTTRRRVCFSSGCSGCSGWTKM